MIHHTGCSERLLAIVPVQGSGSWVMMKCQILLAL